MTSKERIIKAIKGEKTDRVPISTYEMVGYDYWPKQSQKEVSSYDVLGFDFKSWYHKQKSYSGLLENIRKNTDCFYIWFPDETCGLGKALTGTQINQKVNSWKEGISAFSEITIETPKGPLRMKTRVDDCVNTVWELEHLLKDESDVEKLLSIPYVPYRPDVSSYAFIEKQLGEQGVMMPNLGDPLLYVAELFGFTNFSIYSITERTMIEHLLDVMSERVTEYLKYLLENGVKGVYRIIGPEYATPPYLSPEYFRDFVVKYDTALVKMIQKAGAVARLHSHGRVGKLLDYVVEIGADALDPVEALPTGDVSLREAKKRIGNKVCLAGNIQLRDLELMKKHEVVDMVKQTMEEGAPGGRFILMPTAAPITEPISRQTKENYDALIETALTYGVY